MSSANPCQLNESFECINEIYDFQISNINYILLTLLPSSLAKVLHTKCLTRWTQISGKPKIMACPYRCHEKFPNLLANQSEAALLSLATQESSVTEEDVVQALEADDDAAPPSGSHASVQPPAVAQPEDSQMPDIDEDDQPILR